MKYRAYGHRSVYIRARLVILPLFSLLPAPFGFFTKVRNFESFPIQETACASSGTSVVFRFYLRSAFESKGGRFCRRFI